MSISKALDKSSNVMGGIAEILKQSTEQEGKFMLLQVLYRHSKEYRTVLNRLMNGKGDRDTKNSFAIEKDD